MFVEGEHNVVNSRSKPGEGRQKSGYGTSQSEWQRDGIYPARDGCGVILTNQRSPWWLILSVDFRVSMPLFFTESILALTQYGQTTRQDEYGLLIQASRCMREVQQQYYTWQREALMYARAAACSSCCADNIASLNRLGVVDPSKNKRAIQPLVTKTWGS